MDVIIPTDYRPNRLISTLSSLITQNMPEKSNRLVMVNNGEPDVFKYPHFLKLLQSFKRLNWEIELVYSKYNSISQHKYFALSHIKSENVALLDCDILFTNSDTLSDLSAALDEYQIAAISPLGYEVDEEKPVLNEYAHLYSETEVDSNGICDGLVALGFFIVFKKADFDTVSKFWCHDLPYMEDQILIHFMKKHKGYAYHTKHVVYHLSYKEDMCYVFDDDEVVRYLSGKGQEYYDLLQLRKAEKDGAHFIKSVKKWG